MTRPDDDEIDRDYTPDDDVILQRDMAIEAIGRMGHTPHCAMRIAWGDGECECRPREVRPAPQPHEWPADPRDPLVCVHGCGNTPADVFPEEECWRRVRAHADALAADLAALRLEHAAHAAILGVMRRDRNRLAEAARAIVAVWDAPIEDDGAALGAKIDGLRDALAGRGGA